MRGKKNSEKLNNVAAPVAEKAAKETQKTKRSYKKKIVAEKAEANTSMVAPEVSLINDSVEAKKESIKKEKKPAKKVKAEKPLKVKKEKKVLVKTEKPAKIVEKKEIPVKEPIKVKLGKNEMEWIKEKVGFSCSNKACSEWSGRRFNYCPFCGRKAINSQFSHVGDKGERFE